MRRKDWRWSEHRGWEISEEVIVLVQVRTDQIGEIGRSWEVFPTFL